MKFLKRFFDGLQRDLRLFFFILLLLEVYRALFMLILSGQIGADAGSTQVTAALITGLRLSLKTAGAITLFSFVPVTILGFNPRIRLAVGIFASLIISTLFMMRFPYYADFNSTYGLEILLGLQSSIPAIISSVVLQYGFFWRFPVALILTVICIAIFSRLLMLKTIPLPNLDGVIKKFFFTTGLAVAIIGFGIFSRYGGSFNYAGGVNWENAGVTSDHFLNECVPDDIQALYRANTMQKLMKPGEISGIDESNILTYAEIISARKNLQADNLSPYLEKTAKGARLTKKPTHIFVIVGENYMQWPMLGKYADLHIAEGIKSIIAEQNAYYGRNFLPNGAKEADAFSGIITGLSDVQTRVSYQSGTYERVFPSAFAPPLKELGYKVDFWYGGSPGNDDVAKMAKAQGFDNFYGAPDLNAPKQTTWGVKDENLYTAIKKHLAEEPPTVHVIFPVSNRSPYNLDLSKEGYDFNATFAAVEKIPNVEDSRALTLELGHYWYADKMMTQFVREVVSAYPDSLFIITGSRNDSINPGNAPTIFESSSVPFVIFGEGVKKNILPADVVGGHTSIGATLVEMLAPKGFVYYSIAPPLFDGNGVAFDNEYYITQNTTGKIDEDVVELLPHVASAELNKVNLSDERATAEKIIAAMRTVSRYILTKGLKFDAG